VTTAATYVVIAGMPRSGTQLMRRLLGSHTHIAVPTKEFKVHDVVAGQVDVPSFLDRLPLADWGVEAHDLRGRPIAEVYPALLRRCADVVGKPIGGEKSPGNEHCYDEMRHWFRNDRLVVVHMVRNPVERFASLTRAPFRRHMEVDVDPTRQGRLWCASVRRAVQRGMDHSESYRMVRYEDLATDPAAVAEDLFSLIGVDHEPESLDLWAYDSPDNTSFPDQDRSSQPAIRLPPSRASVLTDEQIALTHAATAPLAGAIGYDLAPVDAAGS
jgi:hypothetical protein